MAVEAFADVGHGVFEVEYVDENRVRRREPLSAVWTARFESLPPVRKVRTYAGQQSVTRDHWSTTMRKSLAGLLAAPGSRDLPFTGHPADMRIFIDEVRARVLPGYQYDYDDKRDPLVRWIAQQHRRRTLPNPMAACP